MQQTPSPIEQIKILYTNTNLPGQLSMRQTAV